MSASLSRNTCFVLLMALEEDVTSAVRDSLPQDVDPFTPDERAQALARLAADKGPQPTPTTWSELAYYLDLNQKLDLVARNRSALAEALGLEPATISAIVSESRSLGSIRNRVCHARPLEEDDLPIVLDTVRLLLSDVPFPLDGLAREYRLLRSNQYPFTIAIPEFWQAGHQRVVHNLPTPDFDDTGYIGRDPDRKNLLQLFLGGHPVITVTGEGGIGKTALTLRCLYDVVDHADVPYEAVLYGSLKANRLTPAGIVDIVNAAANETEVLGPLLSVLDNPPPTTDRDELFSAVITLMSTFRVLLVIDNIETIELDALRPLLIRIPRDSKVVLTSRIGLGEIEIRYPLGPMAQRDAIRLFRRLVRLLNVEELGRRDDEQLAAICERLYFSPLLIRWFVEGYSDGRSVSDLLSSRKSMAVVLDFCFANVYRRFTDLQRTILQTLVTVPGPLSEVQLALLNGIRSVDEIRVELQYLYASNVVRRTVEATTGIEGTLWTATDFARKYVNTKDNRPVHERQRLILEYRALLAARDQARIGSETIAFRFNVIAARSTDEATVVRILRSAQSEATQRNFKASLAHIAEAVDLQPSFYEVWRVSAQIKDLSGDIAGAFEDFDQALSLAGGKSQPLLVFYSQFLRKQRTFDGALDLLREQAQAAKAAPQLIAEFAWLHVLTGRPAEAAGLFGRIEGSMDSFTGTERAHYLTQYASALRRAAEAELHRQTPGRALLFISRAADLLSSQLLYVPIDKNLVEEGQRCFQVAARLLAASCDAAGWRQIAPSFVAMAGAFPLLGGARPGSVLLEQRCPEIAASDEYAVITGSDRSQPGQAHGTTWKGVLKGLHVGRDYGFIRGGDGVDYFIHRTAFLGPGTWEDLWEGSAHPVEFTPGEQVATDKAPRAHAVRLVVAEP